MACRIPRSALKCINFEKIRGKAHIFNQQVETAIDVRTFRQSCPTLVWGICRYVPRTDHLIWFPTTNATRHSCSRHHLWPSHKAMLWYAVHTIHLGQIHLAPSFCSLGSF